MFSYLPFNLKNTTKVSYVIILVDKTFMTMLGEMCQNISRTNKNKPDAQAAGPSDATPPVGKIHLCSKIAVTFELIQQFRCPSRFRIFELN